MAPLFLDWLHLPAGLSWLDIGCGTGALSEAISHRCKPAYLCCVDPSTEFLAKAKEKISGDADLLQGSASRIPAADGRFDVVVSALALNFFPDLTVAFSEMKRVLKNNGIIAAYVWDYADRMEFLRLFWDAAKEVDPNAVNFDEGIRFPICNANNLKSTFEQMGLTRIETSNLDVNIEFINFADYWDPFLGGQGPAPGYLSSLDKDLQNDLNNALHKKLPVRENGTIILLARAIAVRGIFER